jgi:hypothetical protein
MYKLSLSIDGDISIEAFGEAIESFMRLLHEVDTAVSGGRSVRWKLADLRRASPAVLTWIGEPRRADKRELPLGDLTAVVGERILSGVDTLERGAGRPPDFSDDALDASKRLAHLRARGRITRLVISAENSDRAIGRRGLEVTERVAATVDEIIGPKYTATGSVEGKLQTISSHGRLFFNVYDSIWGGRVRCEFPEALTPQALNAFDRRVLVTGIVSTDAAGHPRVVKVEAIRELPERAELPQSLKGIDPDYTGGRDVSEYTKKRWTGDA